MPEIGNLGLGLGGDGRQQGKKRLGWYKSSCKLVKGTLLASSSPQSQMLFPVDDNTKLGLKEHGVFNCTAVHAHWMLS